MLHKAFAIVLAASVVAEQGNGDQEMTVVSRKEDTVHNAVAGRFIGPNQRTTFRGRLAAGVMMAQDAKGVMAWDARVEMRNKFNNNKSQLDGDASKLVHRIGLLCWVVFLVAAAVYEFWPRDRAETATPRDMRWDLVKFWCMFGVLWSHTMGYWHPGGPKWTGFPHEFVSHLHMPGFSFVSGFFAAGLVRKEGGQVTITFGKLKSSLRDLVMVQLTMKPVDILFPLTYASPPAWSLLAKAPFLMFHDLWYLDALFMWQLLTPMLCIIRFPVLMAGAVSILCRDSSMWNFAGMWSYFVFYVLGFVLGGGGKSNEERSLARKHFERYLVDAKMRIASCLVMIIWMACGEIKMSEPLMLIFNLNTDFGRMVTPWSLGGWCTDAARICFDVLLLGSFIVIIFMLPACKLLSDAGSRTLYVYVLHFQFLIWNPAFDDLKAASPTQYRPLVSGIIAFIFTLFLGSRLMKALLHHFVQPQWLLDVCAHLTEIGTTKSTNLPVKKELFSAATTGRSDLA